MSYVYVIQHGDEPLAKIGWAKEPSARLTLLQCGNPYPLTLLAAVPATPDMERSMHALFGEQRIRSRGEWFRIEGSFADFCELASLDVSAADLWLREAVHGSVKADRAALLEARALALEAAFRGDLFQLIDAEGKRKTARLAEVTASAVEHYRHHGGIPKLSVFLQLLQKRPKAFPAVQRELGVKIIPVELAECLPLLIELLSDGECCDADVRKLEKAGVISTLARVADVLRQRRDTVRLREVV